MKIALFILLIALCSCQTNDSPLAKKEPVLSKKATLAIFEELVLIESHLQNTYISYENYKESLFLSRDSLLKSKNSTLGQLNTSFDHYASTDKEMAILYEEVLNDFNEKAAKTSLKN
jgi:hypothetical protein